MEVFFKAISPFAPLSKKSKEELAGILKRDELPKGYTLVKTDSICNYFYFIERGITRTYYYKDSKDVTDWLSPENTFTVSLVSYLTRKPDVRGIETLEPSVIWSLPYKDLENLCARNHEIEHLGRMLVSHGLVLLQKRFDDLHFATAAERYKTLLKETPTIIQRVPLGIVASYLGITQETLSRIRSQI